MAILRGIPRKRKGASFRGRVMVDTVRGVLRVRRWPKKRGTPRSASQRWWNDWFRQANLLAKYADANSQVRAKEMTEGSGMYPRDVLLKAMRGRLYFWVDDTGWKWYSMAAIGDISESLDVLAQTVGSVLVRAVDRWRAVAAGTPGQVLTYQGDADAPTWETPAGAGAYLGGALLALAAPQTIPNNSEVALSWPTETYDTANIHEPVANPTRLTVPVGFTRVQLFAQASWVGHGTGTRRIRILKNGAAAAGSPQRREDPQTVIACVQNIASPVLEVVAGDYFEVAVHQTRGGTLDVSANVNTWASLTLVS